MTAAVVTEQIAVGPRSAGELLNLNVKTIRALLNSGELHGWRTPGGHWRVLTSELHHWAQEQTEQACS